MYPDCVLWLHFLFLLGICTPSEMTSHFRGRADTKKKEEVKPEDAVGIHDPTFSAPLSVISEGVQIPRRKRK